MARYSKTIDLGDFDFDAWQEEQRRKRLASQAPKPKKDKGFLDFLSAGTGIAGSLGGAAAGAAAGSVLPGIGTLAGGILGALLGGGGGSAVGEVAENAITGDDLMKNVGKEALIGGVTSVPLGAGFKLARAGVKATTGLGKTGARELVEQAGAQVVPGARKAVTSTARTRSGKKLETLGNKMLASQSQVTGAQARNMGIRPVETIGRVNQRTGLTNIEDMAEVSRGLTGGQDSILDTLTRSAVENTRGVDVGDLRKSAQKLIEDNATMLPAARRKQILDTAKDASVAMRGGSEGTLSTLANPSAALDQANKFRAAAARVNNAFNASVEEKEMATVFNKLAGQIEDAIYKSPGVNESIPFLAKAGSTSLREMAGEAREAGLKSQADAYMKMADEVSGIKDVSGLRKLKKDFVDLGKIDRATAQAEGARAFNSEDAISLMRRNPVTGTLGALMNAGLPRTAGTVTNAGRALQTGRDAAASGGQKLLPLAARQGIGRLVTAEPGMEQAEQSLGQPTGIQAALMASQAQPEMQEPSIGGVTKSQLEQAMMAAAADGNEDAFGQLKSMYDMLPEGGADLSSSTAQLAAKQDTGMQALDQLEGTFEAAGGGQGVLGGNLANLAGDLNLNASAGAYNDQVAGTARQIARAMGEVGAGSDADAQAFISRLPRLTDSPERAAQKIADLRALLQSARENTMRYGAGAVEQFGSNY